MMEQEILNKLLQIEKKLNEQNLQEKKVFTFKEACTFLSLTKWALYHKTAHKVIPHYHRGRKLVFLKSELEKWLLENPVKTINQLDNEASNYVNSPHNNRRYR